MRIRGLVLLVALNGALLVIGAVRAPKDLAVEHRVKIGLVFDVDGLGDKSFNDAAYRGLTRAESELDIATRFIEPGDGSERESALRELAAAKYDLVIGVGFIFTDDMRKIAAAFPDVKFACIDYSVIPGQPPPPANLVGLRFKEEQGSFLVGALAALLSKTHQVGFVGGMDIPLIHKFQAGYVAGVKHVCPACTVYVAYAGTDPKAFADPTTGKELALAQYGRGADIIFHAAGKTGVGVFNAAASEGKLSAIGVDSDQFHEQPCCVLSSMVKGVDVAVVDVIHSVAEGHFQGGLREFGLAENGVGYVYDDHNPEVDPGRGARAHVEALRDQIIDGKIEVPFQMKALFEARAGEQALRRGRGGHRGIADRGAGHHPRAGRRERRGKEHADQDRVATAARRRDAGTLHVSMAAQDRAGVAHAGARDRAGRGHGAPALHARAQPDHPRERRPRPRAAAARHPGPGRGAWRDRRAARSAQLSLPGDPGRRIGSLSVGEQQRVEIVKIPWRGADILLLDEPTAVLTPGEVVELFRVLRGLADQGKTIVIVTHKLDEVAALADHTDGHAWRAGRG